MLKYSTPSKKIYTKSYCDIRDFMTATAIRHVDFFENELQIKVIKYDNNLLKCAELKLRNLTSIINIRNFYNISLVFSYDANVINNSFKKYTQNITIQNIDYQYFIKETSCDIINIIVGNVLSQFQHKNIIFQLSPPAVITRPCTLKKCYHKRIYYKEIYTEFGYMSIFCIIPERFFINNIFLSKELFNYEKSKCNDS